MSGESFDWEALCAMMLLKTSQSQGELIDKTNAEMINRWLVLQSFNLSEVTHCKEEFEEVCEQFRKIKQTLKVLVMRTSEPLLKTLSGHKWTASQLSSESQHSSRRSSQPKW
jgi:hypothetical protein